MANVKEKTEFNQQKFKNQISVGIAALESAAEAILKSSITADVKANEGFKKALDKFKESVIVKDDSTGKTIKDLPQEVYEAMMYGSSVLKNAPKITGIDGTLIKTMGAFIVDILDTNTQIATTEDGKKYKLSNPFGSSLGLAKVESLETGKTYTASWNSNSAKQSLESLLSNLNEWGQNFPNFFFKQLSKPDITNIFTQWSKALITCKIGDVKELYNTIKRFDKKVNQNISENQLLSWLRDYTKKFFPNVDSKAKNLSDKYSTLQMAQDRLLNDYSGQKNVEDVKKLSSYKNFITAYNNLETALGKSKSNFDSLISECIITSYEITDVTSGTFNYNNATISGTNAANTIKATGSPVTINGGEGDDSLVTEYAATISGGSGNDTIIAYGKSSINGGSGNDTIIVNASDVTVDGGLNFDYIPVPDYIKISSGAENVIVNNFEYSDTLDLSEYKASELSAGKYQSTSLEIYSRKTYKTIAILSEVTSGEDNNIRCKDESGNIISVSVDWVLANTPPIINPYDNLPSYDSLKPSQIIGVPTNSSVNNTRDEVIITSQSGNNVIVNSGSNVAINGGTDKDEISNSGSYIQIDGKGGNDVISNGSKGRFPISTVKQSLNGGDSVTINGGTGADRIHNYVGVNAYLFGGEDNDTISNTGNNAQITGDNGNDEINNNGGNNVTVDGGKGKDTIFSSGNNVSIFGGDDNDTISNHGSNVTIEGDVGDDLISNGYYADSAYGASASISGGDGNDYLYNRGDSSTINGGTGDDEIHNFGASTFVIGGTGKDEISNTGDNVTVDSGDGNDSVDNLGSNVSIDSGNGNDTITNRGTNATNITIKSGNGDDSINNFKSNVTIISGSGDDTIYNDGSNVLIDSGTGNDSIHNRAGSNITFNYRNGDGNDTIDGLKEFPIISISGGSYSSVTSGDDVIIKVGDGKITLVNAANYLSSVNIVVDTTSGSSSDSKLITGTESTDSIINTIEGATINALSGNDYIYNSYKYVSVNGSSGNDYIENGYYGIASNVTIDGGVGNDTIWNGEINCSINGGAGDDSIFSYANNVTIRSSEGNDYIWNDYGENVLFQYKSGDGNNTICGFNASSSLTIDDGTGTYSLQANGKDIIVKVGEGKITLADAATLTSVYINDKEITITPNLNAPLAFTNKLSYRTINGTSYNDSILNEANYVTINSASGNDSIVNLNNNVLINTGDGNDYVGNYLNFHTTINGGAGDDTISLSNEDGYNVIKYASGDGNDTIINWSDTNTLNITGDGLYVYSVVDNDAIIYIDDGKVVFKDAAKKNINITGALVASLSTIPLATISVGNAVNNTQASKMIIGTNYNDTVKNSGNGVHVSLGAGRDSIYNTGYALIDAGQNDDTIDNYSNYSTINSGDGNDYIYNRASGVVLYGGAGSDTINFNGQSSFIFGGANNDSIYVTGSANHVNGDSGNDTIKVNSSSTVFTINGGKGNDVISGGVARTILYNFGDGNDSIASFKGNDTLIIGNGTTDTFTSIKSGSDVIITVGEGKVTLGKAATLSNVHIKGKAVFINPLLITGTNAADTIHNTIKGATIQALDGNDSIRNEGINVTINSGAGNDYIFNLENNVSINSSNGDDEILNGSDYSTINVGSGDDTIWSQGDNGIINGESNDDYIDNSGSNVSINGGSDNDYIYSRGYNNIIDGGTGNDSIENDTGNYNYSTIIGGDGDDYIRNGGSNVTINSNSGDDYICNSGSNVTINAGAGNDSIVWYDSHYGSNATISGDEGNDLISLGSSTSFNVIQYSSGDGNDTISGFNETSTISIANGKYSTQKIDDDLIIKIGNGSVLLKGATTLSSININGEEEISWKLNGATATYGNLVTVTGVKSTSGLNIDTTNKKVTVGASALNQNTVSISSGYTLALGNDVYKTSTTAAGWSLNGSSATYKAAATSAGYQLTDNKISYVGASGGNSLVTITGVKSLNGLSIDTTNKKVTVGASALNQNTVSISDGYTLALGNDVYKTSTTAAGWSLNGSSATYKAAATSAGYQLTDNKISYVGASGGNSLVTITGVKSLNGLSIDTTNKKVTVGASALNQNTVSISDGYTLKLSGVNSPTETLAHFSGSIYKSASSSEGYSLSSNKKSISYTPAVTETDLFSLTNVKNTDSITVNHSNKTVTLKADNLTGKNVSIKGDYSLKLGNDVSTSTTKTAGSFTKFKSGTATFKTSSFSDFYSLKNNQVTYTEASGGKIISIKNLKSSATLDEIKSGITISEQKNGSCKITFKSSDLLTTKAPVISATDVTYTVALDKSLNPSALAPDWKVSGTNASLKSDTSAGYTVSDNKVLYSKKVTGAPQLVFGGLVKNSSLSAPVKKVITLDTKVLGSNASLKSNADSYTVKLTGNMSKKTFTGSANADTLNIAANNAAVLGGAGNDSFTVSGSKVTLTGSKGNDAFKLSGKNPVLIYNTGDGNDTVNFVAGMQISLSGSTQIKTLGKSGSDLLLGFGKNSSVKITGAKSTDTLKVSDASGSVTLVAGKFDLANSLTFNSKNSSVTVAKNFTGSLAPSDDIYLGGSKLSGVATINAGNVTSEISISGNAKANFISAGKNNDSILGGNGNDSIAGNAGNDKLYGQNGNDSLSGGKGNDSLWGGDGKDVFIYSAGNDVIADFTAGQDKIQIASGKISKTSLSGSDVLFTIGKGSLIVKNAKGKTISLIDSSNKASSTVVGAQTLTNSNKASVTIGADMGFVDASKRTKAILITGNALANSICGGSKNDSIFGAAGNDSILGNDGNDKLYGDAGNDILLGGKGNDSLWGGVGNDTLTGNDGNDFFIYESGKDVISDYTAGQDKILIAGGKISKTSLSGSNVLFTIGKGSLIVKNAKGKTISLIDSSNKASSTVVGAQTLTNSNKASVTIGADMGFVDASKRTKAILITGNALANTICGGSKNDSIFGAAGNDSILGNDGNDKLYGDAGNDILLGGKGNDSLWGGAGNDSLWGDASNDTFIYTVNEGTDKIFDYADGDMLKIFNADGSDGYFKSSKYSGGDLTLTINGGGKIIFDDVASTTKFNINGLSYNISGSKLVKK